MSHVDYDDVAEAAAIALTEPGFERGTLEVCARGEQTGHDIASIVSDVVGREVRAEKVAFETFVQRSPWFAAQASEPYTREGIQRMFDYYDRFGFRGGSPAALGAILGREPTSLRQFLEQYASRRVG
jgi:uncharacterized protein YbjT (DUF2867 family)